VRRGELYRVRRPPGDPKPARTFVIVSRQALIDSAFSTVVCAPVFSARHGLPSEVAVGAAEGLKHDSAIQCDALMSIEKTRLTDFVGALTPARARELDAALSCALALLGRGTT
jgi:mRNA interferase MazF